MPAQVRPVLKFVRTSGLCVLKQLRLEETLFRASHENWVIANDGTNETAIVMGISGKPHHLLDVAKVHEDMILTIKRFTGGGTVVVDGDTQFVSLIMNASVIPHVQLFPVPLMHWTSAVYKGIEHEESTSNKPPDDASSSDSRKSSGVFHDVPSWRVHQNDYVVGDGATDVKKVGGNAQSISKNRFVHHTSFLWRFSKHNMRYLKNPKKQPLYRENREHDSFLSPLCEHLPSRTSLFDRLPEALICAIGNDVKIEHCHLSDAFLAAGMDESGRVISSPNENKQPQSTSHRSTHVVDLKKTLTLGFDSRAPVLKGA
mmetsp:Transcript_11560/g.38216  ORF Transcript_11560/g.38216 Transcript_11560/m.38216 type:complete len:315 (-) Transcript_11560:49-993(-)